MRGVIFKILFLGIISFSLSSALSQTSNLSGTYKLCHNIPKDALKEYNDSIVEFPVWLHNETIELKKNKKAKITIEKNDNSEVIMYGSWSKTSEIIEIQIENETKDKLTFDIISIDETIHLKLTNHDFKYYKKE